MTDENPSYSDVARKVLKAANRLLAATPSDVEALKLRTEFAEALQSIGEGDAAERLYDEVLAVDPNNRRALVGRINAAIHAGQYKTALRSAEDAANRWPNDKRLLTKLLNVALRLGDYESACAARKKILLGKPDDPETLATLGGFHLHFNMPEKALALFERALSKQPMNRAAHLGQIKAALKLGDTKKALENATASLEDFPSDLELHAKLADLLVSAKRGDEALSRLKLFLDMESPPLSILGAYANALFKTGALEEAFEACHQILRRDPKIVRAWVIRSRVALLQDDTDLALEIMTTALGFLPNDPNIERRYAELLEMVGRSTEADEILQDLLRRNPEDVVARLAFARMTLANGKTEAAEAQFEVVLQKVPTNREAILGCVDACEKRGDLEAAMRRLETSVAAI